MDFIDLLKAMDAPIGIIVLFLLAAIRRDVKQLHKRTNRLEHRLFPDEDDSTPPRGPGIIGGAAALLFVGLLILPGCTFVGWRDVGAGASDGAKVGAPFGPWGELAGAAAGAILAAAGAYKVGHSRGRKHEKRIAASTGGNS